jgi:hypothetical protein
MSRVPISEQITLKMPVVVADGTRKKTATDPPLRISRNLATVDDAARKDGGKTTEDKQVPTQELEKICDNAVDHSRDEPGS